MNKIRVYRRQFFVVHPSDRLPQHRFDDLMADRIRSRSHGRNELGQTPTLDEIQARTNGSWPCTPPFRSELWHSRQSWSGRICSPYCAVALLAGAWMTPVHTGFPPGSMPGPSIVRPNGLRWSGGSAVLSPAAG